ncbi:MAG: ABC transporter ATP-binding protein [Chlamydiia bacterium]|nr:ABC transporter ATP-binding protein [Chlamydiia bacterium]
MICIQEVKKSYKSVDALKGVSLTVEEGEFVSLVGTSGSGKSTLLHLMGLLDTPTSGHIFFGGRRLDGLLDEELSGFRGNHIGFVFQAFHLISELTVVENVMLPFAYVQPAYDPHAEALEALRRVGLEKRLSHFPHELSGGEAQRVSIARALVTRPDVILADEPTGNLDSVTGGGIMELFTDLNREGKTLVMVTHDLKLAERARRKVTLKDGLIVRDEVLR